MARGPGSRTIRAVSATGQWAKRALWTVGIVVAALSLASVSAYWWWFAAARERIVDVTYGRRGDVPLLLDVFRPHRANGAGIVVIVSGSWKSGRDAARPFIFAPFLRHGYAVFAVRHVSQPECLIGDIAQDLHRAVRFIRHHSGDYGIDPGRIGVVGGSSGGHLALLLATRGGPGPEDAADPVDRESSAVQGAAVFFPATDLLNLGRSTENAGDGGPPKSYRRGFGPRGETLAEWKVLGGDLSPIDHVTADLPPVLIIHGDADTLVPLDQSERFAERARAVGREVRLEVRPGKKHGWPTMALDVLRMADWFDEYLGRRASARQPVVVVVEDVLGRSPVLDREARPGLGEWPEGRPGAAQVGRGFARQASTARRIARMWSGVVPQQPPTMATPRSSSSGTRAAIVSGVSS